MTQFALAAEGVLRTHGRSAEAVAVINRASIKACGTADTARPAYAGSLDYYGAALAERRSQIFLASKTHDRTREGSLRLLDQSLERARTDHLDLWQLHDLRSLADLQMIFGRGARSKRSSRHASKGGLSTWVLPAIMIRPSFWKQCKVRFRYGLIAFECSGYPSHVLRPDGVPEAVSRGMASLG